MTARTKILLSVPHMSGHEQKYVREAFETNWLTTLGPNVDAFEREFEERLGRPAVALASGTAALHLALRLVGVESGDEVVCSDLTFVASVNPALYLGARPVFVDSERRTWNMDPALLDELLRSRAAAGRLPKAVVVVHLYGQIADMDPIVETCARHGVALVEDAAEALGATYKGRLPGSFGAVAGFSFNGNKIITTTGGGMLTAHERTWVARARHWAHQAKEPRLEYHHVTAGYNYRMSNVLAGIGRGQLEVLDERVRARRAIAERYAAAFSDLPLSPMPEPEGHFSSRWLSTFLLAETAPLSRDALIKALDESSVESRPVWKPMHLQPMFEGVPCIGGSVAEDLYLRGLCLPSSSSLSTADQDHVIESVRRALAR